MAALYCLFVAANAIVRGEGSGGVFVVSVVVLAAVGVLLGAAAVWLVRRARG